jgi:hypothetical protein
MTCDYADESDFVNPLHPLRACLSRVRLARLLGVLVLLTVVTTVPAADAAFSDSASLPSATIATNQLAAPTGATVTQSCTPPPPVAFRGATSNTGQDAVALILPTGVQAGDMLIAQVSNRGGAFGGVTVPSGWTLLGRTTSGTQVTEAVYWRIAGAAEPLYYIWYLVGSSGVQVAGGMAAYSGVDPTAPVNAFGTASGATASASTPSVTTTVANTVLVYTFTKRQEDLPAPPVTSQRWRVISGNGTATEGSTGADESFVGPGSTQVRATSTGFISEWVTHTIALRPAPGIPSVTGQWTASPSTWATGYIVERMVNGSVQASATVSPVSVTSATDGPLSNGVTYTYRISAYFRSWTSPPVTASLTTNC